MCGITGIFSKNPILKKEIKKISEKIIHRGPDNFNIYEDQYIALGINRLAINDIINGNQPFVDEKNNTVVVYNGEIYNSPQLRKFLLKKGFKFKSKSDGEVIPHLYNLYGRKVFNYLDGMFSIAIWDKFKKKILLARDTAGEKPLYYFQNKKDFFFSSEIKSLNKLTCFNDDLDFQSIWDLPTFLWVPEPNTIYKKVKSVENGFVMEITEKKIEKFKIKCNFLSDFSKLKDVSDFKYATKKTVEHSIKTKLMSDVNVGSFLSGGLDSNIVASVASKFLKKIDTYTIAFPELVDFYGGTTNEAKDAELTAKKIGSNHHTINVSARDFKEKLNDFAYYYDQPTGVSSALGIMFVAEAAQNNKTKVLLSGDGSDECFGGYNWYKFLGLFDKNKNLNKNDITMHSINLDEHKKFKSIFSNNVNNISYALHYYGSEIDKKNIFSRQILDAKIDSRLIFSKQKKIKKPSDFIQNDRSFYLKNEMLTKVDRMTMSKSVESRCPFVSPDILNLSEKIPYKYMFKDNKLKWILREAFKEILTPEIVNRPKHGFNVPIDHWLKNEWKDLIDETFENSSELVKRNIIKKNSLKVINKMINNKNKLHGHTIFSFIILNKWLMFK